MPGRHVCLTALTSRHKPALIEAPGHPVKTGQSELKWVDWLTKAISLRPQENVESLRKARTFCHLQCDVPGSGSRISDPAIDGFSSSCISLILAIT